MSVTIQVGHPDPTILPQTFVATQANVGDSSFSVQNGLDFSMGDYVVAGQYGSSSSSLYFLTNNGTPTTLVIGSSTFSYPVGTTITKIPFNSIKVYRSLTGIGGSYSFLAQIPFQFDQSFTTYTDSDGVDPYSYRFTYFNSNLSVESDFSAEFPYGGFPFYALQSIADRTLSLFVDANSEFITFSDIGNWVTEFCDMLNSKASDSDTGQFIDFFIFTPGTNEYTDISQYNAETIFRVEYSANGTNWAPDVISPMGAKIKARSPFSAYSYEIIDNKMFIRGKFPSNYQVRVWCYTQQPVLQISSDLLPIIYRSYSGTFVDYCMMRANEKARRFSESAAYFNKKVNPGIEDIIESIRERIEQGDMAMPTPWANQWNQYT